MTRSDSVGRFFLAFTPRESVTVTIRRMGYESATFTLATAQAIHNDLEVVLHALPFALPEVTVDDPSVRRLTPLAGFDQRRAQGFGVFITRDEIVRRNTYLLSDILRSQRGVIIARSQGRMALRFVTRQSRSCEPLIWLDGQRAPGLDIDAIAAPDVEGIELYQTIATTPGEFVRGAGQFNCGAVVIWTKRPIRKTR